MRVERVKYPWAQQY